MGTDNSVHKRIPLMHELARLGTQLSVPSYNKLLAVASGAGLQPARRFVNQRRRVGTRWSGVQLRRSLQDCPHGSIHIWPTPARKLAACARSTLHI